MPELPEVETVRRGLEQCTRGFRIARVQVLRDRAIASPADSQEFCWALTGTQVQRWHRRGKYLLADLGGAPESEQPVCGESCPQAEAEVEAEAGRWGVHLRMTGQFLWLDQPSEPCSHTRVRIWGACGHELRFVDTRSFGQMWWIPPGVKPETVMTGLQRLGPEPFEASFSSHYLRDQLRGSSRPIKSALLDQSLVAGVGNIYADEALFTAGIRPTTTSGSLSLQQLERLRSSLVEVLEISIGAGGTTFSDFRDLQGTNGNYGGVAWVYRRGGQPCRRCGSEVQRTRLGGRSSHWCPRCQH